MSGCGWIDLDDRGQVDLGSIAIAEVAIKAGVANNV